MSKFNSKISSIHVLVYVFPCRKMHLFKNRKSEPEFFITVKYRDPLPAHQVVTLSLYFHLTDWLIQWCLFPEKAHDLEQLLGEPFVPALVHANFLGLVYDFLIDSSASLSAELPTVVKKKTMWEGWNCISKEVKTLF